MEEKKNPLKNNRRKAKDDIIDKVFSTINYNREKFHYIFVIFRSQTIAIVGLKLHTNNVSLLTVHCKFSPIKLHPMINKLTEIENVIIEFVIDETFILEPLKHSLNLAIPYVRLKDFKLTFILECLRNICIRQLIILISDTEPSDEMKSRLESLPFPYLCCNW